MSGATGPRPPDALPMPVFLEFLRRLHDGPPQHAAAVRVALAVWENAVTRGDAVQAQAATGMVRDELERLVRSLVELQETGRRWSGKRVPSHHDLADAAIEAAKWDTDRTEQRPA